MTSTVCLLGQGGGLERGGERLSEGRNSGGVGGAAVAAPVLFEEENDPNFVLQLENCSIVAVKKYGNVAL